MKKLNGHPKFYELLKKMAELHSQKNQDYAQADDPLSNFELARILGVDPAFAVAIRMSDKWARMANLLQKGKRPAVNEKITDTALDLAVYCLLFIILYET